MHFGHQSKNVFVEPGFFADNDQRVAGVRKFGKGRNQPRQVFAGLETADEQKIGLTEMIFFQDAGLMMRKIKAGIESGISDGDICRGAVIGADDIGFGMPRDGNYFCGPGYGIGGPGL